MCMDHMLFIHSSVDDQLGHFHPLVIMNHAAVNTCRPISLRDPAFPCFNLLRFPLSCCKTGRRGTPALLLCREHAREAVKVALYRPPAAGLETGPPWNHPAGRRGPGGRRKTGLKLLLQEQPSCPRPVSPQPGPPSVGAFLLSLAVGFLREARFHFLCLKQVYPFPGPP